MHIAFSSLQGRNKARPVPRVAMIVGQFYPFIGGAEKQSQKLAQKLIRHGIGVKVFTQRLKNTPKFEVINNIPVTRISCFENIRLGKAKAYIFGLNLLLRLIKERKEYEIIHIHQALFPAYIGILAGKILDKRCIVKIGNSGIRFDLTMLEKNAAGGKFMASYIRNADRVVAMTDDIKDHLVNFGFADRQIVKIPNGVNVPSMVRLNKKKTKDRLGLIHRKIVTFVGSFTEKKNIPYLINVWKSVIMKRQDCLLVLLGDGPEIQNIRSLVHRLCLNEFVQIKGKVENISDYLAITDVFVLLSHVEGLSNALLEAMSYGIGCVVSDIPGNRQLIKNGENGLLVRHFDIEQVAHAVQELLKNRPLREYLGENARETVIKYYSMDSIVKRYISLYRKLQYG